MHFFDNIYYRIFDSIKQIGFEKNPRPNAILIFSLLLMLNIYSVVIIVFTILKRPILPTLSKLNLAIFAVVILTISYLVLFNERRHFKIESRYKSQSEQSRLKGKGILICYILISFSIFIGAMLYLNNYRIQ